MADKVLVLNLDFSPLTICSVNRAFLLVFLDKADMIEADGNQYLHSVKNTYSKPTVIRIKNYINVPYRSIVLTRQNIFKRDHNKCQYCESTKDLTLDHLVPRSKGGKSTWINLVTACQTCNSKKGNLSPDSVGLKLSRQPFRPSYLMFLKLSIGTMRSEWMQYLKSDAVA